MDLHRRRWLAALPLAAAALRSAAQGRAAEPGLRVGGTGAGLGVLQRLAETLPPLRATQWVPSLGTGGGLKALAAGAIDVALSARHLAEDERAKGLVARALFRTPVVWAAHAQVPVRRVSGAELAALYAGGTPAWRDGPPVRLVLRPPSDADTALARSLSPAMADAVPLAHNRAGVLHAATDGEASEAIERIPGSLGITTLGLLLAERRKVHVLALDGVEPGLATLANGRYPLAKTVYAVTRGTPAGAAADWLRALGGPEAAAALAALGCAAGL